MAYLHIKNNDISDSVSGGMKTFLNVYSRNNSMNDNSEAIYTRLKSPHFEKRNLPIKFPANRPAKLNAMMTFVVG